MPPRAVGQAVSRTSKQMHRAIDRQAKRDKQGDAEWRTVAVEDDQGEVGRNGPSGRHNCASNKWDQRIEEFEHLLASKPIQDKGFTRP